MLKNEDDYKYGYDVAFILDLHRSDSDLQEIWDNHFSGREISFLGSKISQTEDLYFIKRVIINCYDYVTYGEDDADMSFVDNLEFILTKSSVKPFHFSGDSIVIVDGIVRSREKIMNDKSNSILRIYLENVSIKIGSFGFGYSM